MTKISPSVLSADFANLGADCRAVLDAGADMIHFDVMDGHFVDNISFGLPALEGLRKALPEAYFDVHLMISDPLAYASAFAAAGADCITFHVEADSDVAATIAAIRACGCGAGLSLRPATPAEALFPYLDGLSIVLVMGVEPGHGGQSLSRAECARRGIHPDLSVDGGVKYATTAPQCVEAGATLLVAGSAVFCAEDIAGAVRQFKSL